MFHPYIYSRIFRIFSTGESGRCQGGSLYGENKSLNEWLHGKKCNSYKKDKAMDENEQNKSKLTYGQVQKIIDEQIARIEATGGDEQHENNESRAPGSVEHKENWLIRIIKLIFNVKDTFFY
jgi:hypothetical protein